MVPGCWDLIRGLCLEIRDPKPVGAWSGGLLGSRRGWRWGWEEVGGGPAALQWRGVCGGPGWGGGPAVPPSRPPPPVGAPSPLAALVAAGLGWRAARRAELFRVQGRRAGGGPAAPRPLPRPSPHHGAERGGGGGAGPGPPPGWVSAARSGPGGGGRGCRCERGCERERVSVCPRRCGGPACARAALCVPGAGVCGACLCGHRACAGVEPGCWDRPCVCVSEWLPLRSVFGAAARPSEGLCAGVCAWAVCPGVSPPSQCVRLASCLGCLCPGWMPIRGSVKAGVPALVFILCVCVCVWSAGCMSPRVCICASTSGSGPGLGLSALWVQAAVWFGGGEFASPSVQVNWCGRGGMGGPQRSLGETAISSPSRWLLVVGGDG